jgi:hypothetical protein
MHRLDVEVERKIPVFIAAIQYGPVMHEAGGIEQDVGLAGAPGHRGDGGAVAHIEPGHFRDPFTLEGFELGLVDVGGEHGRAFTRKSHGTGAADSDGGGGDECALALQAV